MTKKPAPKSSSIRFATLAFLLLGVALCAPGLSKEWTWKKHSLPVIAPGFSGESDRAITRAPSVVEMNDGTYRMYYTGGSGGESRLSICMATASVEKPTAWKAWPNPVFQAGSGDAFDNRGVDFPNIVRVSDKIWHMYYTGWGTWAPKGRIANRTGLAISRDGGLTWKRASENPILDLGKPGEWDSGLTGSVFVSKQGPEWRMWYTAGRYNDETQPQPMTISIGLATSKDGIRWVKHPGNPILPALGYKMEVYEYVVSKPNLLFEAGRYRMWYSHRGTGYRIGYAESADGIIWNRAKSAGIDVSPEGWDSEIVEYAFVLPFKGVYRMWYTGNGYGASGIGFAESR